MVDEPQSLDGEFAQAVFAQMVRDGVLPAETVYTVMHAFQAKSERGPTSQDRDRAGTLAGIALEVILAGDGEPAEDPEVLFRRDQIRKRTRYIERQRQLDGGNDPTA